MTDLAYILDSGRTGEALAVDAGPDAVDTSTLAPHEGRQRWASAITETFCSMDALWDDTPGAFAGRLRTREYGRLQISTVTAGPHRAIRTPAMIESEEDYFISVLVRGHGEVRQDDRTAHLTDGAYTVVDGSRPFLFTFTAPFQQLIIRVPREDLLARIPRDRLQHATGLMLPGTSGTGSLVSAVLRQAALIEEPAHDGAQTSLSLSLSTLDMLAAILQGAAQDRSGMSPSRARDLQQAKNNLTMHLHDPNWTLQATCLELGMSMRYLQQVFSDAGLTPASWWFHTRLQHAQRLLLTSGATVQEISERTGFKDPAHFSRAFRKQYGTSPGRLRTSGNQKPAAL
jgi:AraC-like DNA-binding protein